MSGAHRRWGWHQLDPAWAQLLVDEAHLRPGDWVLDVGAGAGALTRPLLTTGARVVAIELHPQRVADLRRTFGSSVLVVHADAADLRLPRRPFHVVANPPFGATSALLRRLLHPGSRLLTARLVVQEQVARRWAGPDAPAVNRWGRHVHARLGTVVPRSAFRPRPRVGARVLILERRS